jgi:hypothetical protein
VPPVEAIMIERNEHLDEGTIHAWLDGALPPDESARAEAHANACAACAALVAEARGLIAASSRILSSLDAVPAGVIPGSDPGTDQLAALRARRRATSTRWWRDPRVVAAASLVFIAGTFSVVWRSTTQSGLEQVPPVAPGVVENTNPTTTTPSEISAPSAAAETRERDMKSAAPASPANAPPSVVVTGVGAAPTADKKVEPVAASAARGAAIAANEARRNDSIVRAPARTVDSITVTGRTEKVANADSVARQRAARSPRLAQEVLRIDTGRIAEPSPPMSRRMASAATRSAVGFRMADAASPAGACYELRPLPAEGGQPSAVADTVQLLDELIPERSDPSWRRARWVGGTPAREVMAWREIDSVTVELRTRTGAASNLVQFLSRPLPSPAVDRDMRDFVIRVLPNVRGLPGVQATLARRIDCP